MQHGTYNHKRPIFQDSTIWQIQNIQIKFLHITDSWNEKNRKNFTDKWIRSISIINKTKYITC